MCNDSYFSVPALNSKLLKYLKEKFMLEKSNFSQVNIC